MRIIFIANRSVDHDLIRNKLSEISEPDSIAFFDDYASAEDFINNNIILNQLPLDVIVVEHSKYLEYSDEFAQRIMLDTNRTYSNRDFNFHTIPIIPLILNDSFSRDAYTSLYRSYLINTTNIDKIEQYTYGIVNSVKDWRKTVLDELDNLGIHFNSGVIDYTNYFKGVKNNIDTFILSDNFKLFPRELNYDWLAINEKQIEIAIDSYIKELKLSNHNVKNEKNFHKIFNAFPFLIKRDNYLQHKYQPRLHYGNNQYFEPDYTLIPNFSQKTDLNILEIKLPDEKFITSTKFHPRLISKFISHIFQVNDYKEYLESKSYEEEIIKTFGFIPTKIEYNILIGQSKELRNNYDLLNKRMSQMNANHINIITYDDLLEYQVKYFERIQLLKIK